MLRKIHVGGPDCKRTRVCPRFDIINVVEVIATQHSNECAISILRAIELTM